jgi:hypothetical protein
MRRTRADIARQTVRVIGEHRHVRKLRRNVAAVARKLAARPDGRAGAAIGAGVQDRAQACAAVDRLHARGGGIQSVSTTKAHSGLRGDAETACTAPHAAWCNAKRALAWNIQT